MGDLFRLSVIMAAAFSIYPLALFGPMFTVVAGAAFCVWLAGGK